MAIDVARRTGTARESKVCALGDLGWPLMTAALVLALLALVPAVSFAQSGIAGVGKDTSGAVLPGVTVEASSPALIEKVRYVVTDGEWVD